MSEDQTAKTSVLKGIGVSPGVAIGRCYLFDPLDSHIPFYKLGEAAAISSEVLRFRKALKESEHQILEIQKNLKKGKNYRAYLCH